MAMRRIRTYVPMKGWNTMLPARELGHEYAARLDNVWFEQSNSMNRRPGQTPVTTTAPVTGQQIKHIMEHNSISGSSSLFVWVAGGIYALAGSVWTLITSTFSSRPRSAMMGNILLVGDGVNPAQKFNGTTWSAITSLPSPVGGAYIGNMFHTHKGRMYAAGDPSQRLTVYYSDSSAGAGADNWNQTTGGGFLDLSYVLGEGDEITGITSYLGMLVILLKKNIVFYQGEDPAVDFTVHKTVQGMGCVSHDSIQGIGNDVMFLSKFGFKTLKQVLVQGDAAASDTSVPINNFVVSTINNYAFALADVRSTYSERHGVYLCSLGDVTLAYHPFFDAWTPWYGFQQTIYTKADGQLLTASEILCSVSSDNTSDVTDAAQTTTVIPLVWETSPYRAENETKPRWNRIEVIYEAESSEDISIKYWLNMVSSESQGGTLTITPTIPQSNVVNSMLWGSGTLSTDARRKWNNGTIGAGPQWIGATADLYGGDQRVPISGRGELITFRITNSNDTKFRISGLEVYWNDGGLR